MKSNAVAAFGRSLGGAVAAVALVLGMGAAPAAAETDLVVYTAVEADELASFKKAFEAEYPDINIKWVRDSTGIMTAKLLAEKDNPQADVVWGLAATSLMQLANDGFPFEGYAPKGLDNIKDSFRDKATPPMWVGQRAWIAAVTYNTIEAEKHNLPVPESWKDLTDPVYKDMVVMPNPNSSGTGFLDVSSWIQIFGEEAAWKFMDDLHQNIALYTHSGSKPAKMAAAGEYPIGISFAYRGAKLKNKGAPVEVLTMKEGLGWDMEAMALVATAENKDAAKALIDWSVTRAANEMYNEAYAVVAYKGDIEKPVENFPADIAERMIDNDFQWAGANRMRILEDWMKRYDTKSEAK